MELSTLRNRLCDGFRWVSDGGTSSSSADFSGWLRDPAIVASIGQGLASLHIEARPQVVLSPESGGYRLGPLVAHALGAAFVGASKRRRDLTDSDKWVEATTPLDYQGRNMALSLRERLIHKGDRVLLVDDWAYTGGQMLAMRTLVDRAGGLFVGSAVVVDALTSHAVRRELDAEFVPRGSSSAPRDAPLHTAV